MKLLFVNSAGLIMFKFKLDTIIFHHFYFQRRYAKYDVLLRASMGQKNTKSSGIDGGRDNINTPPEVTFDDFEVLRAIGRGAFGKVRL